MKPSIAIVGCGRVGNVLGRCLAENGHPVKGVASKSLSSAKTAAARLNIDTYTQAPWEITALADVVLLTTPDGVIAQVCEAIAARRGFKAGSVVLHCSGAHPSTILSAATACQALIGSLHPLQSIASPDIQGNPFEGIVMSVEGEPAAVEVARQMAADLGARCFQIHTQAKTLYHAAAAVASNYLVTLLDFAFKLLEQAGISAKDAFGVLGPLVGGTLKNIEAVGIPEALTGPIARGDHDTVERHLAEIGRMAPDLLELYKQLGTATLPLANAKANLPEPALQALRRLLESA